MGRRPPQPARGGTSSPSVMYGIANRRTSTRVIGLPMIWETPLRTGNLRDPNGPQVTFAFESFVDELAAAAQADPVQFRLQMLARGEEDEVFARPAPSPPSKPQPGPMGGTCAPRRGHARLRQSARTTSCPGAALPIPTAPAPLPRSLPKWMSIGTPGRYACAGWYARMTAAL